MTKEQRLQFAELLDEYESELKAKKREIRKCETVEEYAAQKMLRKHLKVISEIKRIIYYQL